MVFFYMKKLNPNRIGKIGKKKKRKGYNKEGKRKPKGFSGSQEFCAFQD